MIPHRTQLFYGDSRGNPAPYCFFLQYQTVTVPITQNHCSYHSLWRLGHVAAFVALVASAALVADAPESVAAQETTTAEHYQQTVAAAVVLMALSVAGGIHAALLVAGLAQAAGAVQVFDTRRDAALLVPAACSHSDLDLGGYHLRQRQLAYGQKNAAAFPSDLFLQVPAVSACPVHREDS